LVTTGTATLLYYLTDHLGSIVSALDSSGNLLSQQRYLPFGEVRLDVGTITETDFGYTSQRNLADLGLMDYRARFYSPALGRFLQPDTIVPGGAQGLNRFSYVLNSPIVNVDPTGHVVCTDDEVCFGSNGKHLSPKDWLKQRVGIWYSGDEEVALLELIDNGGEKVINPIEFMIENNVHILNDPNML